MRYGFASWAVAATVVVAGCLQSEASEGLDGGEDSPILEEGTSSLIVQVVDTELQPLSGALVFVDDAEPVTTRDDGGVRVDVLLPGTHRIRVDTVGYTGAGRQVSLVEGETKRVQFILAKLPSTEPHIELLHFRGYSFCDTAYYAGSGPGNENDTCYAVLRNLGGQKPRNLWAIEMQESWRFVVSELSWKSNFGGTADSMRLVHSRNQSCSSTDPCYAVVHATYYARLEGEPGKTELNVFYDPYSDQRGPPYPNGSFRLQLFANWIGYLREFTGPTCDYWTPTALNSKYKPGCLGVGVSTGMAFEVYVSVFHWAQPADRGPCCPATRYSALPDR